MSRIALAAAALLVALAFAGCSQKADLPVVGGCDPCPPEFNMDNLAVPKVDARKTLDDLKAFSQGFPYRQSGSVTHVEARKQLASHFENAGLEVVRQSFPSASVGGALKYDGENILGIKWGADRSHWIVVGAHYDITEGAVFGTYDDGSGTMMVEELAAAFADLSTTRTIVFAEFDQEELGLVGSAFFLKSVQEGTFAFNGTIDGMLDLDMVGITWPHPAHLITWENSPVLKGWIGDLANASKVPYDHLEFRKPLGGSSDGATFIKAGIPTAYLWSDWDEYILPDGSVMPDTPLPYVGPYPWWHKMDTYDTMVASAGDEATLQAGFQTTLDIVSPLLVRMASPAFVPAIEG